MVRGGLRIDRNAASGANDTTEAERQSPLDRLSWDTMRLLLALADAGSFRSAAMTAGVSLNTIRSKIDRLERQFSTALLHRSVEGVLPTQAGLELVAIARGMATLGRSTGRVREHDAAAHAGTVRVDADAGLATGWLIPHIGNDSTSDSAPVLDVHESPDPTVLFRDVDATVGIGKPTGMGVVTERLGSLHILPFASAAYLDAHGTPASQGDLVAHRLVLRTREHLAADAVAQAVTPETARTRVALHTESDAAHFSAVASGFGIGSLPSWAVLRDASLRPLDLGVQIRRDLYLAYREGPSDTVSKALDSIRKAFDRTRFPCFADEFVHPSAFADRI